jgi:hypothetical protein
MICGHCIMIKRRVTVSAGRLAVIPHATKPNLYGHGTRAMRRGMICRRCDDHDSTLSTERLEIFAYGVDEGAGGSSSVLVHIAASSGSP